jgi:hypothetical protein
MESPAAFSAALFLTVAFIAAGLVHSAWLRSEHSRRFAIPLDGGRLFRGRPIFGVNKTVRGFMAIVPAAALCFALLALGLSAGTDGMPAGLWQLSPMAYFGLGAWAGFCFMLAELPNSFVKRQLRIAPGMGPSGRIGGLVVFVVDRVDSIVGMLAGVSLVVPTPWATWGWVILVGPGLHWSFSVLLYRLGVKARPA